MARDPFWALVATARRLHGPGGCPWDRAQTVGSLLPHLIEETWEAFSAQRRRQRAHLREELGDVLYTTLFLTLLAEREGWFTLRSLLQQTRDKMVRRHPHVFGSARAWTAEDAYHHWQAAKRRERFSRPPSRNLRPLLVGLWDALLEELSGRPSARSRRGSVRSPVRAPHRRAGD